MKKLFRALSLTMAAMVTMFQPMQITHGTTMCCAECQMIKKDDEVEMVDEQVEETTL